MNALIKWTLCFLLLLNIIVDAFLGGRLLYFHQQFLAGVMVAAIAAQGAVISVLIRKV